MAQIESPSLDEAVEQQVMAALSDPRWDFRTVEGIAQERSLSPSVVADTLGILLRDGKVRRSLIPDVLARPLFTLKSKEPTANERLGKLRNFIAKSSS